MSDVESMKKMAAEAAVERIKPGMVVGLGTGSTARYAIERIARLLSDKELYDIVGIPSSGATEKLARTLGIPLGDLETHSSIDVNVDGADEVDDDLNLIKGGGGALLREKVIAQASRENVIIVDQGKLSPRLGTRFWLPVEVLEFGWKPEREFLREMGATVELRKNKYGAPFRTDSGNYILDANFGAMKNPGEIAARIDSRAGVVGHGLFLDLATEVVVGGDDGPRAIQKGGNAAPAA
ncbi:MAG: ribose-5-phosphate isomerase RpiA [Desulfatibacillaceae bacterium]